MDADRDTSLTVAVRFACGALFGLVLGFYIAASSWVEDGGLFAAIVGATAVSCGWLSARFSRRFWSAVRHLRWFVP